MDDTKGFHTINERGDKLFIKKVIDSYGTTHTLTEQLGETGGQGIVFKTKNPKIAVKFLLGKHNYTDQTETPFVYDKKISSKKFIENAINIEKIIKKPFPKNSHISYPMARLEYYSGYVMLFMEDMCDFSDLIDKNKVIQVGGLRRKYDLLAKLSIILSKLHSLGMVYCDISLNNVFMTNNINYENQNIWLIDADNIYIPSIEQGGFAYTLKYAAPEIVNSQSCCSTNSDIYAFASLAFEVIFNLLPFAGKKTANWYSQDDSSEDDWDAEVPEQKSTPKTVIDPRFSGKYAWILDFNDDSNRLEGLSPQNAGLYITNSIYILFSLMFTDGKNEPALRPPSFIWTKYLFEAKDLVINCSNPNCEHSFIFNTTITNCPYCNEKLPEMIQIFKNDKLIFVHELNFHSFEHFYLPERLFLPFNNETGNKSYFEVTPQNTNGKSIEFKLLNTNIDDKFYILNKTLNTEKQIINKITMELENNNSYILCNKSKIKDRQIELKIVVK